MSHDALDEFLALGARPQLLTTGQVARVIRLDERRIRYWLDRDVIPFVWIGGRRYVKDTVLIQWAETTGLDLNWDAVI